MPVHEAPEGEAVNHPKHYNSHPSGIECIEVVRHFSFNVGNAIKYLWRSGLKDTNPTVQELKKAIWYLEDEVVRLQSLEVPATIDPAVVVAATRQASPPLEVTPPEGDDAPLITDHAFDPGWSGMSTQCNHLIVRKDDGSGDTCNMLRRLHDR